LTKLANHSVEWNDIAIRWKLASLVHRGNLAYEQKIYHLLLDMRLSQEPLPSLLAMVSREIQKANSSEATEFMTKVQEFVFEADFPPQYSEMMIEFLKQNSHVLPTAEDL